MFTRLQALINRYFHSFKFNRSVSFKVATLVFFLSLGGTTAIVRQWERDILTVKRDRVSSITNDYAIDIQRNMQRTLSVTYAVSALVNEYQGVIPNFSTIARDLLPLYPGAYALALLPDGVVGQFVALDNIDIASERTRLQPMKDRESISVAPQVPELSLITHTAIEENFPKGIGYLPIFLEDKQGNKYFWGFTTVSINLFQVLEDLHIKQLEQRGYAYQLYHVDLVTNKPKIITQSATLITKNPVERTIEVANNNWTLKVTPIQGWQQPANIWLKFLLGFTFSFMLATLVKLFLDSKAHVFELENVAYFDPLTSLPNRRLLLYRLEQILARAKRTEKTIAICYLDLDDFQAINKRLGHKMGDYILVRIAKRLQKFLRFDDVIARVGGDEFAIVLQDLSQIEEAEIVLERIREAVTNPINLDLENISVSTTIGVTIYERDNNSIDTLLKNAYFAMNYTKKHNKGGYTLFSQLEKIISSS